MREQGFDHYLTLRNTHGAEVTFELLDVVEYAGEHYVVLAPVDDEQPEVKILRIEVMADERESYVTVDNEAVAQAVFRRFMERNGDLFEIFE